MNLFYHRDWRGNFGDDLNIPFFESVWPGYRSVQSRSTLYGIGTLLNEHGGVIRDSVIFGSGFGYGKTVSVDRATCTVLGVRGYKTAEVLGESKDLAIGDPALIAPLIPELLRGESVGGEIIVAPHHRTAELWKMPERAGEFCYLDPGVESVFDYIKTIAGAKLVLAEAMHAAIMAAAFEVPFIPISIRGSIDETKWNDFGSALGFEPFRFNRVSSPPIPVIRRTLVSRLRPYAQRIGLVKQDGVTIKEADIERIERDLRSIIVTSPKCVVDPGNLKKIQGKILRAAEAARAIR